jgi:hypothetical protein
MSDQLYSNIVRLEYYYERRVLLPALPGNITTEKRKLTSSEQKLKENILDEVADALIAIHGNRGAR